MYVEGKARIEEGETFLNPAARFSRDLSIAIVSVSAAKDTRILDPTAATGIRAIRYYKETKARDVTLLEINKKAAKTAARNLKSNRVKARLLNKSIQEFANSDNGRFDFIDLDPFGSPAPDLYDIMKVSKGGTCLFMTATDTAVLCGAHEKACLKIYDAKPMHNELCHEVAARILLGFTARTAAQFNFGIEVMLALSYAHYLRVIVKLKSGAESANESVRSMGYAYYCNNCGYRNMTKSLFPKESNCPLCESQLSIAGKMWAGRLKDKPLLKKAITQFKKQKFDVKGLKILKTICAEPDAPLYYSIPRTTKKLGVPSVSPLDVIDALKDEGFDAARTHFDKDSVRTTANIVQIKEAIQRLAEQSGKV